MRIASATRDSCSRRGTFRMVSAYATFSPTDMWGNSA